MVNVRITKVGEREKILAEYFNHIGCVTFDVDFVRKCGHIYGIDRLLKRQL